MSILSDQPDGMGFYYGFAPGDIRQINVRLEKGAWVGYVGGEPVTRALTKEWAELEAMRWAETNPDDAVHKCVLIKNTLDAPTE
jgi:hypothetical protein